jgi:predicted N-acetyltransferase YhbS
MSDLEVRAATDADLPEIIELLRTSMGRADDERFVALFRWKHIDNAFGASPMWVACSDGEIVGLRVFMRWEFERGDSILRAVRAVDTATRPDFQGRGIFTTLTRRGLDEVTAEGVDFVFNTPNDKSRPGYLKMGWRVLGRPVATIRPVGITRLRALLGARTAAQHWSEPLTVGVDAVDFLADRARVDALLSSRPPAAVLRTRSTVEVLAWRFGLPALGYRAISDDKSGSVAFVRVRRRGAAREGVVALMLGANDRRSGQRLLGLVRRTLRNDADYLLALGSQPFFVPLRRFGPIVTARGAAGRPPETIADMQLSLGDVELF